jgi:hypothetical protein
MATGALALAAALAAAPAWSAAPAAPAKPASPAATLRFAPKARRLSTCTLHGRYEIATRDVSFEAPDAYIDGFNFWAGRMKGQKRSEVYEMMTMTQDTDGNGMVPFRRTIPRFNLEFEKQGQIFAAMGSLERDVAGIVWEGTLDPFGNLKEKRKVAGKDDPEIAQLAIPEIERLFPSVEGVRDIAIGEGFKEERVLPLPTKLNIAGLEDVSLKVTRDYILKSVVSGLATFEVKMTYTNDPAYKPKVENTVCAISGGGAGEAIFEVRRGVFLTSRVRSSMRIDIEAPLRPLPGHPETAAPSSGKSHIDLDFVFFGQQTVKRTWGEEED